MKLILTAASAAVFGALVLVTPAAAQSQQDKQACSGDVRRLCKGIPPVDERVLACLQANRGKLSRSCRKTLEDHGV